MKKKQKIVLGISISIISVLVIGGGIAYLMQPDWLVHRLVEQQTSTATTYPDISDGLHVMLLGTGSPMPDANRAGPSTLVIAGKKHFVVDTGPGSTSKLATSGISPAEVDAVFLTHYHSDHIGDLGELMLQRWALGGDNEPLPVYGPVNVTSVVEGFNDAYFLDSIYRTEHHGEENIPINGSGGIAMEFDIGNATMASQVIYDQYGIKISMFNVDHFPVYPAVGYKFEYKERSVVISGDTVYSENLEAQATDVDLLVCEALNAELVGLMEEQAGDINDNPNNEVILHDIQDYHITPEEAATLAENANVGYLVYYHMIPAIPDSKYVERLFLGDASKIFSGKIDIGEDGFFISMPKYSEKITTTNLLKDTAALPSMLVITISVVMLGLVFLAGRRITRNKQLKISPIIIALTVLMGLLLITRIGSFVQIGFTLEVVFYAVVESVMLVWSIMFLYQNRKTKTEKIEQIDKESI